MNSSSNFKKSISSDEAWMLLLLAVNIILAVVANLS